MTGVSSARPSGRGRPRASGRGRRPGGQDTRGQILGAARESFAGKGFTGTTIRGVAAAAGVDPALVHHYFGTKDDLLLAALDLPADPRQVIPSVFRAGLDGAGERLLRVFLSVWDSPEARLPLVAMVRAAVAGEQKGNLLAEGMLRMIFQPLRDVLPGPDVDRRAQVVASQLIGLVVTRYVLVLEPLASMPADEVVAWIAPTIQRYVTMEAPPVG